MFWGSVGWIVGFRPLTPMLSTIPDELFLPEKEEGFSIGPFRLQGSLEQTVLGRTSAYPAKAHRTLFLRMLLSLVLTI